MSNDLQQQKHILFTEDDPAIRDSIQMMLEMKGYRVTVSEGGGFLFEGHYDLPDLFILDKQLPGIDGLDICRKLKSSAETSHIPVLMLSASPQVCHAATRAGADGFVEKPFAIRTLLDAIEHLIG